MVEKKCFCFSNYYVAITLCFNVLEYVSGECRENVRISLRNTSESGTSRNLYKFETDTQKCNEVESLLISSHIGYCNPKDLDVEFSTVAVLPNGTNMLPYVLLNVSVRVNVPSLSVFLRFECLDAPNLEDDYCHNHEEQYRRWNRMIWPCRSLTIFKSDLISLPYFFDYHCFRLFAYSHYRVNVTLVPPVCSKLFIVTIPDEAQLHPSVSHFYNTNTKTLLNFWSPLASIDLSLKDGIMIRYGKKPELAFSQISIAVFETTELKLTHILEDTVDAPANEYKWKNVPAGNYVVYLYVNRFDCDLLCDNSFGAIVGCTRCPSTRIFFTVRENKFLLPVFMQPYGLSAVLVGGAGIFCFTILTIFMAYLLVVWRRQKAVTLCEVSLLERTTAFIVYTDDCEPHSACIAALARFLQDHANVDVFLDQFELKSSDTVPARWFIDKLTTADHVVLIFSEGANAVFHGAKLIQRQPFPEFFSTALNFLLAEHYKDGLKSSLLVSNEIKSRFAFAYLTYSMPSVIPVEIGILHINIFKLPEELENLVLWLHNQPSNTSIDIQTDISVLESLVNDVRQYRRDEPTWLEDRLQTKQEDVGSTFIPQNIAFQVARPILTTEDQADVAEALHLEPPDMDSSVEEIYPTNARFALIGSPSDSSSDSDAFASDRILLQHLLATKCDQN